jgi:hypothetical protein
MLERGTDDLRNPYEQTLLKSGYGRVLRRVEHSVVTETSGLLLAHAHNAPVFVATHWLHETNPVLGIARHHYKIRILVLKRVGFPVVNQVRNGGDSSASEIKKQTKHLHVKNNDERFLNSTEIISTCATCGQAFYDIKFRNHRPRKEMRIES